MCFITLLSDPLKIKALPLLMQISLSARQTTSLTSTFWRRPRVGTYYSEDNQEQASREVGQHSALIIKHAHICDRARYRNRQGQRGQAQEVRGEEIDLKPFYLSCTIRFRCPTPRTAARRACPPSR